METHALIGYLGKVLSKHQGEPHGRSLRTIIWIYQSNFLVMHTGETYALPVLLSQFGTQCIRRYNAE